MLQEKKMLEAWLGMMSWSEEKEPKHGSAIAPDRSAHCMKEHYVQGNLAIVRTLWKLHVNVQNKHEATFSR